MEDSLPPVAAVPESQVGKTSDAVPVGHAEGQSPSPSGNALAAEVQNLVGPPEEEDKEAGRVPCVLVQSGVNGAQQQGGDVATAKGLGAAADELRALASNGGTPAIAGELDPTGIQWVAPDELHVRTEFSQLMRPLTEIERAELFASIAEFGVRIPVVVWRWEGKLVIVEGHSRVEGARKAGKRVRVIEHFFQDLAQAVQFARETNECRRRITDEELREAYAKTKADVIKYASEGYTQANIAKELKISRWRVREALKEPNGGAAKSVGRPAKTPDSEIEKIERGEKTVEQVAAECGVTPKRVKARLKTARQRGGSAKNKSSRPAAVIAAGSLSCVIADLEAYRSPSILSAIDVGLKRPARSLVVILSADGFADLADRVVRALEPFIPQQERLLIGLQMRKHWLHLDKNGPNNKPAPSDASSDDEEDAALTETLLRLGGMRN